MYQSPWRRVAFIAVSCVVPVIANGFRGLGIVMLGHFLGSAQAAATDHVLYGWIFFSLVIVALALGGMPFRQDSSQFQRPSVVPGAGTRLYAALAVLPVIALAAIGPVASLALDSRARMMGPAPALLSTPSDCAMTAVSREGNVLFQSFQCGEATLVARTEMLPRRANPSWVVRAGMEWASAMVPGHDTDNRMLNVGGVAPLAWHSVVDEDSPRVAAYLLFVDGRPARGGLHDRMVLARDLLGGASEAPISVAVAITATDRDGQEILKAFLAAQGDLTAKVRAALREKLAS
jgi:exosortase/archaeosortase family protein